MRAMFEVMGFKTRPKTSPEKHITTLVPYPSDSLGQTVHILSFNQNLQESSWPWSCLVSKVEPRLGDQEGGNGPSSAPFSNEYSRKLQVNIPQRGFCHRNHSTLPKKVDERVISLLSNNYEAIYSLIEIGASNPSKCLLQN